MFICLGLANDTIIHFCGLLKGIVHGGLKNLLSTYVGTLNPPPSAPYTHNDNSTYINSKIDHSNTLQFRGATSKHGIRYGGGIQWEALFKHFMANFCHG
jgi:hypothetical protein